MQELIALLIDEGHAYVADDGSGDVFFAVAVMGRLRSAHQPEARRHGGIG